ncbi:MAG: Phosphoglycerate dehydrogenase [Alphaproteobacteria bacterium]|nr:Phosphoglycerate dehydrogenase [Alphaproteobacteria bacterium]
MRISVLDECFLSDENINYLKSVSDFRFDTEDIKGSDIILADMYERSLNKEFFSAANNLKLLCINSTGFDKVDLQAAEEKGVKLANVPGFSTEAVAEHVFALILASARNIVESNRAVSLKPFEINPNDRDHTKFLGFNLYGKTLGILGLGAIGQHVAKIAHGFGMQVIAYNPGPRNLDKVEMVSREELLVRSDILTLHAPLNKASRAFINADTMKSMKPGAMIINTARGDCIVSKDLADALQSGHISAAGLDTWGEAAPVFSAKNCLITPHSAWFTKEALAKIGDIMVGNIKAFLYGKPINFVN